MIAVRPGSSGGGIRTHDLRLMRPARTATPLHRKQVKGLEPLISTVAGWRATNCATLAFALSSDEQTITTALEPVNRFCQNLLTSNIGALRIELSCFRGGVTVRSSSIEHDAVMVGRPGIAPGGASHATA